MAFKTGTKGCIFHLLHIPTGLRYVGAFSFRHAYVHNVLWSMYFTNNPTIKHLISVFGTGSFEVTVRKLFSTRNEAIDFLKRFYNRVHPETRMDWISDKSFPILRSHGIGGKKLPYSHRGSNNPHYGHKTSAMSKLRNIAGQRAVYKGRRWAVDPLGNEHHILPPYILPPGFHWGRNTRNWSRWTMAGAKPKPKVLRVRQSALEKYTESLDESPTNPS